MTPSLRGYQEDVRDRARARLAEGCRRVLIQAATGAGKTCISSDIIARCVAKGKRALFLAHRRRLITQKSERLKEWGVPHGIIMAGHPRTAAPVQVSSRDTLLSRAVRNDWMELPPADLVVVDEARLSAADTYRSLIEAYPHAHVVGQDATPARPDGRGLYPFYQALECAVPTSRLVAEGWLVPVRCYAPAGAVRRGKARATGLAGDPVFHWKKWGAGRPTVLFAPKCSASRAVVDAFNAAGIPAEHIDAHTPDAEREAVVARLRAGKTLVVSNCGVWTDGVDIPELSCCVLLRAAKSCVLYRQMVGRVMRPHPSKTDAVLIDHAGACVEHGLPTDDVEWSLKEDDTVDRRNRDALKEGRRTAPVCCAGCGLLFQGAPSCPGCGKVPPRRREKAVARDEVLVEVARTQDGDRGREARQRVWDGCLAAMAHRGQTCASAAWMFKRKTGEWPGDDLRNVAAPGQRHQKVADVFPQFAPRMKRV